MNRAINDKLSSFCQRPLVIFGSAKAQGNTKKAVDLVMKDQEVTFIDLSQIKIGEFSYDYAKNKGDDFLPLVKKMLKHPVLILATPTYWYSMSTVMKRFIDRWTDLLMHEKDLGKKLAGKPIYLITSYGNLDGRGFLDQMIEKTANYMKMNYRGCYAYYSGKEEVYIAKNIPQAQQFTTAIWSSVSSA